LDRFVEVIMAVSCPFCRGQAAKPVRFTAWGGVIGPFLLSLVKCGCCGSQFNGRTGRCVKKAARIYTVATLAILVTLMALAVYQFAGAHTAAPTKGTAMAALRPLSLT
jgi:hypothetical protein